MAHLPSRATLGKDCGSRDAEKGQQPGLDAWKKLWRQ